jgi:hypothetical protein
MPYIYGITRRERRAPAAPEAPAPAKEPELSYRDVQARAKELDIPANQTRDELEQAIAEAERE